MQGMKKSSSKLYKQQRQCVSEWGIVSLYMIEKYEKIKLKYWKIQTLKLRHKNEGKCLYNYRIISQVLGSKLTDVPERTEQKMDRKIFKETIQENFPELKGLNFSFKGTVTA